MSAFDEVSSVSQQIGIFPPSAVLPKGLILPRIWLSLAAPLTVITEGSSCLSGSEEGRERESMSLIGKRFPLPSARMSVDAFRSYLVVLPFQQLALWNESNRQNRMLSLLLSPFMELSSLQ